MAEPEGWHGYLDLNRWDSAHYEKIVLRGYRDAEGRLLFQIKWYPGYPLLVRPIRWLTGWKVSFIFSLLSSGFTLAFWLLLWSPRLVREFGAKVLATTSVLILVWPGSFYWFAGMTEPLAALLLLTILYLWIERRSGLIAVVLAYATSVKQVFVPLVLAFLTLEIVRERTRPGPLILKGLLGLAGFILFGFYGWLVSGNFFISTDLDAAFFSKRLSLLSLIDLTHYARLLPSVGGITAFGSMLALLAIGLRLTRRWSHWGELVRFFRKRQPDLPAEVALWWIALAYTTFCILGSAYWAYPFAGMMRYQTANVSIFLLVALQFRETAGWRIGCLLLPISWVSVFWQNALTVRYWSWIWVD